MEANKQNNKLLQLALPALGLGAYWTWVNLSTSNTAASPWLVESVLPLRVVVPSFAYILTMALLLIFHRCLPEKNRPTQIAVATAIAGFGSIVSSVASGILPPISPLARAASSIGTAFLVVAWGEHISMKGAKDASLIATGSFFASGILYLLLSIPELNALLLFILPVLPLACGALLLVSIQANRETEAQSVAANSLPAATLLALVSLVVCVFLNEVIRIVSTPLIADRFTLVGQLTQIGCLLTATVGIIATMLSKKPLGFDAVLRALLPLMIAGFLSFIVVGSDDGIVFVILGSGYWCLQILIFITLCSVVHSLKADAIPSFAFVYGSMQVGILLAKPVGMLVSEMLRSTGANLSYIVAFAVIAVVVIAMFPLHGKSVTDAQAAALESALSKPGTSEADRLASLASAYGLSPRETDVFMLLARGRSLPFIQQELHIATGTAQTHVRHIYGKMDVHTRQEFLDRIENDQA